MLSFLILVLLFSVVAIVVDRRYFRNKRVDES